MNKQCQTNIYINDVEIPCHVEFDYQPAEPQTWNEPGIEESVQIVSCIATPGVVINLFTPGYDWLLTNDVIEGLEEDAIASIRMEEEAYECDKAEYLYNQRAEAA